ncbi:MAG TPA: exodeoxyribonuclease VII small subunit [Xanthomonadales bacterium]|nr:exodeoxyribonuclease VII small subunit [Xanthomonadales bacterium]
MTDKPPAKESASDQDAKKPDFEHALTELESLVTRLETGELTLDESLKQFKRGVELTRRCQKILDQAQQVVEKLSNPEDESSAETLEQRD